MGAEATQVGQIIARCSRPAAYFSWCFIAPNVCINKKLLFSLTSKQQGRSCLPVHVIQIEYSSLSLPARAQKQKAFIFLRSLAQTRYMSAFQGLMPWRGISGSGDSDFCFWTGLGAEHGVMLCFPLREAGSRRLHNRLFWASKTKNHMYLTEEIKSFLHFNICKHMINWWYMRVYDSDVHDACKTTWPETLVTSLGFVSISKSSNPPVFPISRIAATPCARNESSQWHQWGLALSTVQTAPKGLHTFRLVSSLTSFRSLFLVIFTFRL